MDEERTTVLSLQVLRLAGTAGNRGRGGKGAGSGGPLGVQVHSRIIVNYSVRTSTVGTANAARLRANTIIVFAIASAITVEKALSAG